MKKHLANTITVFRIVCSVLLLSFPALGARFYILYLLCGLSDMIDGTVARKTNSVSEFGSKLDTVADLVFIVAALIKLLPIINLPKWLWLWAIVIAVMRIGNILWGYVCKKKLIALHTSMNKLTGLLLFLLPLLLPYVELQYSSVVVCAIATFSAIQEGYYIGTGRENV